MPRTAKNGTARGESISLRISPKQRELIDRAADALGRNRSDFMLETACREATAVLLDQRLFMLDEQAYKRFVAALDKAPTKRSGLQRLLASKAPWER